MKKYPLLLALLFLLFSCKEGKTVVPVSKNSSSITVTKLQFNAANMEIQTPTQEVFNVTVKASGKIDVPPQNRAKVAAFIGGYVKSTALLIGDKVKKGQALLTLENTIFLDIQKEYLDVVEQITYLKSEFQRQKALYDEQITSQKNYLKAESDFRRAQGMYQSLRNKLLLLNINPNQVEQGKLTTTITIYAPIAGYISVMNANLGMLVSPSDVILEIVNNNDLHVELAVFEKDILKIHEGQGIDFIVPEASKDVFLAKVHLVGKSIEGNDRTINVHGHLDENIKQKLICGMFVEADIIIASKKRMALPIEALITENNTNFVLLLTNLKNGTAIFTKVAVIIGDKTEKFVEITPNNQINATSKILTKGAFEVAK